jgi:hypothetical protein
MKQRWIDIWFKKYYTSRITNRIGTQVFDTNQSVLCNAQKPRLIHTSIDINNDVLRY